VALYAAGKHTISELEELFSIARSTVYRATLERDRAPLVGLIATLPSGSAVGVPGHPAAQADHEPGRDEPGREDCVDCVDRHAAPTESTVTECRWIADTDGQGLSSTVPPRPRRARSCRSAKLAVERPGHWYLCE
jgi:hypothetical protein